MKNYPLKLVLGCLTLGVLISCKKSPIEEQLASPPDASMSINTQTGVNSCFNWQTSTHVTLTNGQNRILPWYSGTTTQIPDFILSDYKKEDGWEMLYNLLSGTENGQNYLIFYNKFTGIVRTYYFLSDDITMGSNGMWALGLSNENAMLNNIGYFATPADEKVQDPLAISTNLSVDQTTKGIARGWNAFNTEITYDPLASGKNIKMRLFSSTSNISQVSLTGDIALASSGTIVSVGSKNGLQDLANSTASSGGDAAKDWIKNKVKPDNSSFIKTTAGSAAAIIAGGGVKAIINAGINLLFGSFIGKKTEPANTEQKIEFKTNGTLTVNGTISSSSSNNVSSVANLYTPGTIAAAGNFLLPCYDKKLGVWNLQTAPIVQTQQKAPYWGEGNAPDVGVYGRNYYLDPNSIQVVINPDLVPEIQSYSVSTDLLYYDIFRNKFNWSGTNGGEMKGGTLLYNDGQNKFYTADQTTEFFYGSPPPPMTDPTKEYDFPTYMTYGFNEKFVVKVTVTIIPKSGYNQDPIVITRSYIPKYQFID